MTHALCFNQFSNDSSAGADEPSFIYRFNDEEGCGPELVRDVFMERGMVEYQPDLHREHQWNIWWKGSPFRASHYALMKPWQRINHHPKAKGGVNDITSKDGLSRNMRRMRGIYNDIFNFTPETFHLPREERVFKDTFRSLAELDKQRRKNIWIYKPADMSRGRGIFVFNQLSELRYGSKSIVQRYITNPFLISGYKFDLRLYAVVVSYRPLVIYLLNDGIVRFSTERFDLSSLDNVYSHLTNTSINKFGPSYATKKVGIGSGCKWTLTQLRCYLYQKDVKDRKLWAEIIYIITLTILSQAASVPKVNNCFELFGFDIMFDVDLKPWLLEVNFSPAMKNDCSVDSQVKKRLVHSLCDLLGLVQNDAIGGRAATFSLDQFFEPYSGGPGWTRERARSRWEAARAPRPGRACSSSGGQSQEGGPPRNYNERCNSNNNQPVRMTRRILVSRSSGGDDNSRLPDSGFSSANSSLRGRRGLAATPASGSGTRGGVGGPGRTSLTATSAASLNSLSPYPPSRNGGGGGLPVTKYRLPAGGDLPAASMGSIMECSDSEDVTTISSSSSQQQYRLPPVRRQQQHPSSSSSLGSMARGEGARPPQSAGHARLTASYCKRESSRAISKYQYVVAAALDGGRRGVRRRGQQHQNWRSDDDESDSEEEEEEEQESHCCLLGTTESDRNPEARKRPVNLLYGVNPLRRGSVTDRLPPLDDNYGDLKLIFPFNKVTRRACTILDEKTIIRETLRLLRYRSKKPPPPQPPSSAQTASSTGNDLSTICDIPEVWTPM